MKPPPRTLRPTAVRQVRRSGKFSPGRGGGELGRTRTEIVNRIHRMLLELIPGGAKKFLTRGQASYLLRTAPTPVGIVARTCHDLARELIDELTVIDAKIRAADSSCTNSLPRRALDIVPPDRPTA